MLRGIFLKQEIVKLLFAICKKIGVIFTLNIVHYLLNT